MTSRVTPMIHVPDVQAAVDWYRDIGFAVDDTYGGDGDGLSFAILSFGSTRVMFNEGGKPSSERRREVDLHVETDNVDDVYERLKDRVEVVQAPDGTFYGMREFIIRDLNRFWITFGQPSLFALLMKGVKQHNVEQVRRALAAFRDKGGADPKTLSTALAVASAAGPQNDEVAELLRQAGAMPPPQIDAATLASHVGKYRNDKGMLIEIKFRVGRLIAEPPQPPQELIAIDATTFRPIDFDGITISFRVESGRTTCLVFQFGSEQTELKKVGDS
jgi:uncharacterized glyoxalase superfamily protein PhnB